MLSEDLQNFISISSLRLMYCILRLG